MSEDDFDAPAWHLKNKAKWGPEFTARHARTVALLGRKVQVTLGPERIVHGIFLGFGEGGDVEILESDGFVHYCWPMLEISDAKMPEMQGADAMQVVPEAREPVQEPAGPATEPQDGGGDQEGRLVQREGLWFTPR